MYFYSLSLINYKILSFILKIKINLLLLNSSLVSFLFYDLLSKSIENIFNSEFNYF